MASDEKTLMCVILEGMNPPPTDLLCGWHSSVMAMKVAAAEMGGWMDGSVLLSKSCYRCMNALISAKNMSHVWFPAFWVTAWPCELSPYGMSVYSWFSLWRIHCFISFTQISLTPPPAFWLNSNKLNHQQFRQELSNVWIVSEKQGKGTPRCAIILQSTWLANYVLVSLQAKCFSRQLIYCIWRSSVPWRHD